MSFDGAVEGSVIYFDELIGRCFILSFNPLFESFFQLGLFHGGLRHRFGVFDTLFFLSQRVVFAATDVGLRLVHPVECEFAPRRLRNPHIGIDRIPFVRDFGDILVGRCFGDMGRYVERLFEKLFV